MMNTTRFLYILNCSTLLFLCTATRAMNEPQRVLENESILQLIKKAQTHRELSQIEQKALQTTFLYYVQQASAPHATEWVSGLPQTLNLFPFLKHAKFYDDGWGPLHQAAIRGHTFLVNLLVNANVDVNERHTKTGCTALHCAAAKGQTGTVKKLLDSGANIDERSCDGSTALIHAAHKKQIPVIKTLLNRGANVFAQNKNDITTLALASDNADKLLTEDQRISLVNLIQEAATKQALSANGLRFMVANHRNTWFLNCLHTLLLYPLKKCEQKPSVLPLDKCVRENKDDNQRTLLHVAAIADNKYCLTTLVGLDLIDISTRDLFGKTYTDYLINPPAPKNVGLPMGTHHKMRAAYRA